MKPFLFIQMKLSYPTCILAIPVLFFCCCHQNSKTEVPKQNQTADSLKTAEAIKPPPADPVMMQDTPAVKFIDPLVLYVDTDFKIKVADKIIDRAPGTPTIDAVLIKYLRSCYAVYRKLPAKMEVRYANNQVKMTIQKDLKEAIAIAQDALIADKHIKNAGKPLKYPILYQKSF